MVDFNFLYASKFAYDIATTAYESHLINQRAVQSYATANAQAAINNQLNFNAHLALNEQQALNLKKYGIDRWELLKKKRREEAKNAVLAVQRGMINGLPNEVGGSFAASYNNVSRHASLAMARKDLNQLSLMNDFKRRHKNIDLTTINQNNIAFSKISQGADPIASTLAIAGSGLQIAIDKTTGTTATGAKLSTATW